MRDLLRVVPADPYAVGATGIPWRGSCGIREETAVSFFLLEMGVRTDLQPLHFCGSAASNTPSESQCKEGSIQKARRGVGSRVRSRETQPCSGIACGRTSASF